MRWEQNPLPVFCIFEPDAFTLRRTQHFNIQKIALKHLSAKSGSPAPLSRIWRRLWRIWRGGRWGDLARTWLWWDLARRYRIWRIYLCFYVYLKYSYTALVGFGAALQDLAPSAPACAALESIGAREIPQIPRKNAAPTGSSSVLAQDRSAAAGPFSRGSTALSVPTGSSSVRACPALATHHG